MSKISLLALALLGACSEKSQNSPSQTEVDFVRERVERLENRVGTIEEANRKVANIQLEAAIARSSSDQARQKATAQDAARDSLIKKAEDLRRDDRLDELERRQRAR